jgi:hypothetical protein
MSTANAASSGAGGLQPKRIHVDPRIVGPLRDVASNVCGELESFIERLFVNADDYFFDTANKATNYSAQMAIFDAMRQIRQLNQSISDGFVANISVAIKREWCDADDAEDNQQQGSLRPVKFDEITIQSDAEAEISAARSMISSRAHALYGNELRSFTDTINAVLGAERGYRRENPLDVRSITTAFCDAIESLELENAPLLCMLSLFEREVTARLGGVYARSLAQLEENGISIIRPEVKASPSEAAPAAEVPTGAVAFRELQQHLVESSPGEQRAMNASGSAITSRASVRDLVTSMVVAQDHYLDQLPDDESPTSGYPDLGSFLMGIPANQGGFQNAGIDELHTLRFISDLFGHIFNNPDVSLACKSLVARLQFPVLTLAIVEKAFFDDPKHPAREFLNRLAHDGIGWPNNWSALSQHRMYKAAEALVQRIIDELPCNRTIFQHSLKQWSDLVARTSAHTDGAERRVNEAALGQARLKAARRIVARLVNESTGAQLPPGLIAFVHETMFHALVVICVKFGTESSQWKEVVGTYTDLVRACRRDECEQIGRLITSDVPGFMARIAQTLEPAGYLRSGDSEGLTIIEKILQNIVNAADSGTPVEQSMRFVELEPVTVATDDATSKEANDPMLEALVPGTWIEIDHEGEDETQRCRLVVFVDQTQTYVFSNDLGQKAFESTAAELLRDLQSRRIKILSEGPVVDQAMQELVDVLRGDAPDA